MVIVTTHVPCTQNTREFETLVQNSDCYYSCLVCVNSLYHCKQFLLLELMVLFLLAALYEQSCCQMSSLFNLRRLFVTQNQKQFTSNALDGMLRLCYFTYIFFLLLSFRHLVSLFHSQTISFTKYVKVLTSIV